MHDKPRISAQEQDSYATRLRRLIELERRGGPRQLDEGKTAAVTEEDRRAL